MAAQWDTPPPDTFYAWGNGDDIQKENESNDHAEKLKGNIKINETEFNNRAFDNDSICNEVIIHDKDENDEDVDDGDNVSECMDEVARLYKELSHRAEELESQRKNTTEAIEERRRYLIDIINSYSDELLADVNQLYGNKEKKLTSRLETLTQYLKVLKKIKSKSDIDLNWKKEKVSKMMNNIKKGDSKLVVPCTEFRYEESNEYDMIKNLFGELNSSQESAETQSVEEQETNILKKPDFIKSFQVKTSKDRRDVGLVDIAINGNDIIVVDKHNKLVKVFSSSGRFLNFVGRKLLKSPFRLSVMERDFIFVSDESNNSGRGTCAVYMFDAKDYSPLGTFLNFAQPSCHCAISKDGIALVEYGTSRVLIYAANRDLKMTFDAHLSTPVYLTYDTVNKHFVMSDWRANCVRIFDNYGNVVKSIDNKGSGEGELNQPQGVACDCFGNVIIADKINHRIQIFSSNGHFVLAFDNSKEPSPSQLPTYIKPISSLNPKVRLPVGVGILPNGYLAVCEYHGHIKIFKYLETELESTDRGPNENDADRSVKLLEEKENETII